MANEWASTRDYQRSALAAGGTPLLLQNGQMRCPACQHENGPNANFCEECGTRLARACSACDTELNLAARTCPECGAPVAEVSRTTELQTRRIADYTPKYLAEKILQSKTALRGEHKQVTVLFCDVVASTPLASALGAESMHVLLSDFFAVALTEVHRFEGTVKQFLGDGFMAIFGAPLAYEDHAGRAGLAALAIRDAVARARSERALPGWSDVQVRMGLNSGQVVVGAIGDDLRMDYTASGETTHIAARLQGIADPGEILCGEATVTAGRNALHVERMTPVTVKGVHHPLAHYRLVSALEHTERVPQRWTVLGVRNRRRSEGRSHCRLKCYGISNVQGRAGCRLR